MNRRMLACFRWRRLHAYLFGHSLPKNEQSYGRSFGGQGVLGHASAPAISFPGASKKPPTPHLLPMNMLYHSGCSSLALRFAYLHIRHRLLLAALYVVLGCVKLFWVVVKQLSLSYCIEESL